MPQELTEDQAQRLHDQRRSDDDSHDAISCWCCCFDCDFDTAAVWAASGRQPPPADGVVTA